jgi:hypothetical protein
MSRSKAASGAVLPRSFAWPRSSAAAHDAGSDSCSGTLTALLEKRIASTALQLLLPVEVAEALAARWKSAAASTSACLASGCLTRQRVDAAARLVEQDDVAVADEGGGEREPPLHAAAERLAHLIRERQVQR